MKHNQKHSTVGGAREAKYQEIFLSHLLLFKIKKKDRGTSDRPALLINGPLVLILVLPEKRTDVPGHGTVKWLLGEQKSTIMNLCFTESENHLTQHVIERKNETLTEEELLHVYRLYRHAGTPSYRFLTRELLYDHYANPLRV